MHLPFASGALRVWAALVAVTLGVGPGHATAPPQPRALAGVSACTLIEGVPQAADPIRRAPPFRAAFAALDRAGSSVSGNRAALRRFERALGRLMAEAERVFHPRDPEALDRRAARRFLERHVFGPHATLEIGDERFEPRPGVAAGIALAACRAGAPEVVIAHARRLSEPHHAPLRALAALLLLDLGRAEEAVELAASVGEGGFLGPWVGAELATSREERRRLHAVAARRVSTPDQRTAVAAQRQRHGLNP